MNEIELDELAMKELRKQEPDYRAMYLRMVSAIEDAMNLLNEAQRECEEMYIGTLTEEEVDAYMQLVIRKKEEAENSPHQGA